MSDLKEFADLIAKLKKVEQNEFNESIIRHTMVKCIDWLASKLNELEERVEALEDSNDYEAEIKRSKRNRGGP